MNQDAENNRQNFGQTTGRRNDRYKNRTIEYEDDYESSQENGRQNGRNKGRGPLTESPRSFETDPSNVPTLSPNNNENTDTRCPFHQHFTSSFSALIVYVSISLAKGHPQKCCSYKILLKLATGFRSVSLRHHVLKRPTLREVSVKMHQTMKLLRTVPLTFKLRDRKKDRQHCRH